MSFLPSPLAVRPDAVLVRIAPVSRIVAGGAWLLAAVVTSDPAIELRLLAFDLVTLFALSGLPFRPLPRRLAPLLVAAVGLGFVAATSGQANADPAIPAVFAAGPLRLTGPSLSAGLAMAMRIGVIVLTSLLVFGPSDTTQLADSLVQQWRMPERFAFGTVAAIGLAPMLASDWASIGAARRLRGLEPRWLPGRIVDSGVRLLSLLVVAIRRGERLALAMDARGFDSGIRRSHYRIVQLTLLDAAVVSGAIALAVGAFTLGRQ